MTDGTPLCFACCGKQAKKCLSDLSLSLLRSDIYSGFDEYEIFDPAKMDIDFDINADDDSVFSTMAHDSYSDLARDVSWSDLDKVLGADDYTYTSDTYTTDMEWYALGNSLR